jgi:predicted protein tyrosine phosphatase
MDPFSYAMGLLAAQSVRRQFEDEASSSRIARTPRSARRLKKFASLARRLATGKGALVDEIEGRRP